MYSKQNLLLHILAVLIVTAVSTTVFATVALAQSDGGDSADDTPEQSEPPDPLELYDANDNGVIDADEVIQATADYLNGLIDGALAYRVWLLFTSTLVIGQGWTQPCNEYDEDDSGVIERPELINAINDYLYEETIDKATMLAVINCHYSGTHSIAISGLPGSIQSGGSQAFTVTATNLLTSNSYAIKVTTNHSSIGFDIGCSTRTKDYAVTVDTDNSDYSSRPTLYACNAPGGSVTARLIMGDDVGELVSDSQSVTVTASATPPPTPVPATPVPTPDPTPLGPKITIAAEHPKVRESDVVRFVLTSDPAPTEDLTVTVSVTETGSFLRDAKPTQVNILANNETTILALRTQDDSLDEASGEIEATLIAGSGYRIESSSSSATVTIWDGPPAPTGLRANGDIEEIDDGLGIKVKVVTLTWETVSGVTAYGLRWAREVCTPGVGCQPDGGSVNPNWNTGSTNTTAGTDVARVQLGGLSEKNLYRVEVQAVNADDEGSKWSDHTFIFPTDGPLTATTAVALMDIDGFQADGQNAGSYRYTICLDETDQGNHNINAGSWTVSEIATEIRDAFRTWQTAVGDSTILSVTSDDLTHPDKCEYPGSSSNDNQVVFVDDRQMKMHCGSDTALGCWLDHGGDLSEGEPFDKQSVILRASGGGRSWSAVANGCSQLRTVAAHEAGHAFGIDHPHIPSSQRRKYLMYENFQPVCGPQAYDVVAAMANYQSR